MTVASVTFPTIVNAVELASFIMEKRQGSRVEYSSETDPTLNEINERLLASEGAVSKMMNSFWKPRPETYETMWTQYGRPFVTSQYAYNNKYNRKLNPSTINLLHNPILSVDKLECIVNNVVIDLVASADFEEGWQKQYYIDYRNGSIEFRRWRPQWRTPILIEYTIGRLESTDGTSIKVGTTEADPTETTLIFAENTKQGKYSGKLLKFTSGVLDGEVYRIVLSSTSGSLTTLTVLTGYTMVTDGLLADDTFEIYAMPDDIKEMIKIYTYLGILQVDPTYQHNFTNPFEDPNPLFTQWEWLAGRFALLVDQRKNTMQLLN